MERAESRETTMGVDTSEPEFGKDEPVRQEIDDQR
jgi:hypothetical protein